MNKIFLKIFGGLEFLEYLCGKIHIMKNKEIERKFFVSPEALPNINFLSYMDITQGYLAEMSNAYIYRLRQVLHYTHNQVMLGEEYFQTIKGWGSMIRAEFEINILVQQFHILWPLCKDITIHKHRYDITKIIRGDATYHIYLDKYLHELSGFYVIEVEFNTIEECDEFTPLSWFGIELTEDNRFTNYQLAVHGLTHIIGEGFDCNCWTCGKPLFKSFKHKCIHGTINDAPKIELKPTGK